ncbi:hypothetical protein LWI29_038265 [Acer saccharum]|uniref:Retrovirus-related Pol polyprotein from transposon TNT 1-94-like beta-barrel domain-containing protein n=1 Tax=Acer saccharum TaxID=4024 RepID=A0AA39VYD1_ACESA|nr:hypothetical protein LWI29_038265 [Acer saccharum]
MNCCVKLNEGNLAEKGEPSHDSEDWGNCFLVKNTTVNAMASINFEKDWIIDSGCGHHLTEDESNLLSFKKYTGNHAIVTADNRVHPVEKDGTIVISDGGDSEITINNVYHVPRVKKNLFSVAVELGGDGGSGKSSSNVDQGGDHRCCVCDQRFVTVRHWRGFHPPQHRNGFGSGSMIDLGLELNGFGFRGGRRLKKMKRNLG